MGSQERQSPMRGFALMENLKALFMLRPSFWNILILILVICCFLDFQAIAALRFFRLLWLFFFPVAFFPKRKNVFHRRLFRLMEKMKTLRLLVMGLVRSFVGIFWVLVLLFLVYYIFAVVGKTFSFSLGARSHFLAGVLFYHDEDPLNFDSLLGTVRTLWLISFGGPYVDIRTFSF